jgi:hypothetical protein
LIHNLVAGTVRLGHPCTTRLLDHLVEPLQGAIGSHVADPIGHLHLPDTILVAVEGAFAQGVGKWDKSRVMVAFSESRSQ